MKNMRTPARILAVLLCLVAALSLAAAPAMADSGDANSDTLTVGVPIDRCPVFYRDTATGEITGIGVDLMRAAAEEAGYTAEFKVIEEDTLKDALDNEEYDVIMPFGSAIKSTTGQSSIVSDNLTQTPFTLVTENNRALPPLNDLKVGMLRSLGGSAETVRQLFPGIEITLYETMAESVDALRAHKVDALLHNSYVWSYVLQKPAYSDLAVQPSAMFSMDFRAGTLDTPEGQEVIGRLNDGIAALPDTLRQAIVLDHTSRRLYQYDFFDYLYQYGLIVALVVLLFVALIAIFVLRQRAVRLEQEEKMRQLIDHDPLTGLLSMSGFRKRVEELLHEHPDIPYLISYNNIKNFKFINDSQGMKAGDELLCFWADKSIETLSDEEAIGRIEGDHFIVLRRIVGDEGLFEDGRDVLDPVRNFFVDRGEEMCVQICSGIYVLTSKDYQQVNVDRMVDFARVAEKRVRDSRKEGYEFYNPNQWEMGKQVADVVGYLPIAIKAGELQVWYQPQVNYETGEIAGLEALCRWNHAKLGLLGPAKFVPILEESGLIYELDSYVWDRVCQDLKRWNDQGHHWSASVNVSRRDIQDSRDIPGHFHDLVEAYGLAVDQLRVEITETAFAEDPAQLIETTEKLRELGFQVEMDDFGSGYSSLHMLKEVPVDRIKLDLDFLTGTGDSQKGHIIVSHVVKMLQSLEVNLIAEGVESEDQARFLQSQGCVEMQGYYFYKPMPAQEFEKLAHEAEPSRAN